MKRSWILTLGLAALLVGLVAIPVLAATGTATQPTTPGSVPFFGVGPMGGRGLGISQIASILNMSVAELQAALQSGKSLAEIAADKGISRSDLVSSILEQVKTRIEQQVDQKGTGPFFGRGAGIGPLDSQVASILKMSVADLQAARQSGKSLAEIAADKGISRSDLIASMLKVHQDALAARVADGSLTQAQADQILASMKTRIEQQVDYKGVGHSFGRGRGMGQGFGPRWGQTSPAGVSNS